MKRILIAFALLLCWGGASADDMVARKGSDTVRLTQADCPAAVLQLLPPHIREQFRAASAQVDGKSFAACWAMRPDGMVFLQYEDGDGGLIPRDQFKRAPAT